MTGPEPSSSEGRRSRATAPTPTGSTPTGPAPGRPGPDDPLTRLRGASVDINPRRARQVVVAACLIALAVVAVILLIAGAQKNDQADNLHQHGVRVDVTVTGCLGLLGGSGSNGAGYACTGTYTFDGRHFTKSIPGAAHRTPGSVTTGVIVPDNPGLLSTPALVAQQQASWKVFILPVVLLLVLAVTLATMALVRRGAARSAEPPEPQ